MFASRNTRGLHGEPHPAPLRQVSCRRVFRHLLRSCEPRTTCAPLNQCDSYETNLRDQMWHMASFMPATTGLPMWIMLSPEFPPLDQPRMLVCKGYDPLKVNGPGVIGWFTVTVEEEPRVVDPDTGSMKQADIELVTQYIKLNLDTIVRFWKDDDLDELFKALKPLQNSGTATHVDVPAM